MIFQTCTVASFSCCLFCWGYSVWSPLQETFHLFIPLIKSSIPVCFESLLCYMMKLLPFRLDSFLWKLTNRMFLQTSEIILLLPPWVASLIKISEPAPEAAMQPQAMTLPPHDKLVCFGWGPDLASGTFAWFHYALFFDNSEGCCWCQWLLFFAFYPSSNVDSVVFLGRPGQCLFVVSFLFRSFKIVVLPIPNPCIMSLIESPHCFILTMACFSSNLSGLCNGLLFLTTAAFTGKTQKFNQEQTFRPVIQLFVILQISVGFKLKVTCLGLSYTLSNRVIPNIMNSSCRCHTCGVSCMF